MGTDTFASYDKQEQGTQPLPQSAIVYNTNLSWRVTGADEGVEAVGPWVEGSTTERPESC